MPHLSPMKWKLMALLIILLLATFASSSWWTQLPNFPKQLKSLKPHSFTQWPWS